MMKVGEIFAKRPFPWGLRGDPYLWQEMAERLADVEMPATAEDLRTLLVQAYEAATERPFANKEIFVVERFKHGGMSSGGISPQFWQETAVPLLVSRHVTAE